MSDASEYRRELDRMSDEDIRHLQAWRLLSSDEKATLIDLAKLINSDNNEQSLRDLLRIQSKITTMVVQRDSMNLVYGAILKSAGLISALGVIFVFVREYMMKGN